MLAVTTYEYRTLKTGSPFFTRVATVDEKKNELGRDGWEFYDVEVRATHTLHFAKRPTGVAEVLR